MKKLFNAFIALAISLSTMPLVALDTETKIGFQKAVQTFGASCYEMVSTKKKIIDRPLSDEQRAVVENIEQKYAPFIAKVRADFESNDEEKQIAAIKRFGKCVSKLAYRYQLSKYLVFAIPASLDSNRSLADQVSQITDAVSALSRYFNSIRPRPTMAKRVANIFFNNYWTSVFVPNFAKWVAAPAVALGLSAKQYSDYKEFAKANPDEGIFYGKYDCCVPTKTDADAGYTKSGADLKKAYTDYINSSANHAVVTNKAALLKTVTDSTDNQLFANIQQQFSNIQRYDSLHWAQEPLCVDEESKVNKLLEKAGISTNPATSAQRRLRSAIQTSYRAASTKVEADQHSCAIPKTDPRTGAVLERGQEKGLKLNPRLSEKQYLYNLFGVTKDITWAIRPVLFLGAAVAAANYAEKIQAEQYGRNNIERDIRRPINAVWWKTFFLSQQFNNPTLIKDAPSEQHLIDRGYQDLITMLKNPFLHKGIVLHGTNQTEAESVLKGIVVATGSYIVKLKPLAASDITQVKAIVEYAIWVSTAFNKTVIIHLEDADYIAAGSRALENIKNTIFANRNPYLKITVVATATDSSKMAPELMDYLPTAHAVA